MIEGLETEGFSYSQFQQFWQHHGNTGSASLDKMLTSYTQQVCTLMQLY